MQMEDNSLRLRKILVMIICLFVFCVSYDNAFAGGGAGEGSDSSGHGGCGGWWDTCHGLSWQKYKVIRDLPTGSSPKVHFHYTPNTDPNGPVLLKGCKTGQYIYNLGFTTYYPADEGYQVSTQKDKNFTEAKGSKGAYTDTPASDNRNTTGGYLQAAGYASNSDVKKAFDAMKEYLKSHPNAPFSGNTNISWNDVGYFCFSPEAEQTDYYAISKVSNSSDYKTTSYNDTGVVKDKKTVSSSNRTVNVGDVAYVTFAHNIYADVQTNNVSWEVRRNVTVPNGSTIAGFYAGKDTNNSGGGYYTISMPAGLDWSWNLTREKSNATANITEWKDIHKKYIAQKTSNSSTDDRTKRDADSWYVSRDHYRIKFLKTGTYTFCETIYVAGTEKTKACSKITVKKPAMSLNGCDSWAPSSYKNSNLELMGGTSKVVTKVKNVTRNGVNGVWEDTTYAKPGDKIEWIHCYYPEAQMSASMDTVGTGNIAAGSGMNNAFHGAHDGSLSSSQATNNKYDALSSFYTSGDNKWTNKFQISATNLSGHPANTGASYTIGNYSIQRINDTYSSVDKAKVGTTVTETSKTFFPVTTKITNEGRHQWACQGGTCRHGNDYIIGSASGASAESHADLKVPYNFNNIIGFDINDSNGGFIPYAGEKVTLSGLKATIKKRYNRTLNGTYATKVDSARVRVASFLIDNKPAASDNANGVEIEGGADVNICANLGFNGAVCTNERAIKYGNNEVFNIAITNPYADTDHTVSFNNEELTVPDTQAGKYFCIVAAIYPSNSGSDTNMDKNGSGKWRATIKCNQVQKKPNIQVWGSGMLINGKADANNAQKFALARNKDEEYDLNGGSVSFGSWAEHNIIANSKIAFASGASFGEAGEFKSTTSEGKPNGRTLDDGIAGSYNTNISGAGICDFSPLTMPNAGCSGTNMPGGDATSSTEDREKLIERFGSEDGEGGLYERHDGACEINQDMIPNLDEIKTHIYVCKESGKDLEISSNIIASKDGNGDEKSFSKLTDIPKIIIFSGHDIKIGCGVNRIDAVLIATNMVDACSDSTDINDSKNSNQLIINGSIIARELQTKRTYGAATGVNSAVPSVIINYDTSLYLWGRSRNSEAEKTGKLKVVHQSELAPRL